MVVVIDHFTRWIEVKALASITSKKAKDFFYDDIIYRFGIPKILISNNGMQFNSKEFPNFCEELGIKQRFTSLGYPQTNGATEVTNKTILQGLKWKNLILAKVIGLKNSQMLYGLIGQPLAEQ